jgi:chloramphenicol 3-O-phosphotransferase
VPSRIVVVSGACGAGKSATLRAMVDVLDDVATLETDRFYMMFDPEWKLDFPEAQPYWDRGMALLRRTVVGFVERDTDLIAVASNGIQHSFLARAFARSMPGGVPVHHVTLDPGLDVVKERIAQRAAPEEEQKVPDWVEGQLTWFRQRYGRWTHVIDNARLTPEETAAAVHDAVAGGCALLAENAAYFEASEPVRSPRTAVELMLQCGRAKTDRLLIDSTLVNDDFFDLSTGFAGEFLQKFVNYGIRLAMVFYEGRTYSPSFERFLTEARRGREMRAFAGYDAAVEWLEDGT